MSNITLQLATKLRAILQWADPNCAPGIAEKEDEYAEAVEALAAFDAQQADDQTPVDEAGQRRGFVVHSLVHALREAYSYALEGSVPKTESTRLFVCDLAREALAAFDAEKSIMPEPTAAEAKQLFDALGAIIARINGKFDHPALVRFGPLGDTSADCLAIAERAITDIEQPEPTNPTA